MITAELLSNLFSLNGGSGWQEVFTFRTYELGIQAMLISEESCW